MFSTFEEDKHQSGAIWSALSFVDAVIIHSWWKSSVADRRPSGALNEMALDLQHRCQTAVNTLPSCLLTSHPSQPHQQLCSPNPCSIPNKRSGTKGLCVLVCVRCLFSLSRVLNTCFTCASGEPWSQALHSVTSHFSGQEPVHHV